MPKNFISIQRFICFVLMVSSGMTAEPPQSAHDYQLHQINLLLSKVKPLSLRVENMMSMPIYLNVFYRQHTEDIGEEDTLLGLISPRRCYYIEATENDSTGCPIPLKVYAQDELFLTIPKNGYRKSSAFFFMSTIRTEAASVTDIAQQPQSTIMSLRLLEKEVIPHIKKTDDGLILELSNREDCSYPLPLVPISFADILTNQKTLTRTAQIFYDQLLPSEGLSKAQYVQKLQQLYDSAARRPFNVTSPRIPLIIHTIWPDSASLSKLFSGDFLDWLQQTLSSCSSAHGWQHYIWLTNPAAVSQARAYAQGKLLHVQFKAISELVAGSEKYLTSGWSAAKLSKILRFYILEQYGGVFRGADVEIVQSLKAFNGAYDLYCGLGGAVHYPVTSLLAAKQHHPVLQKAINLLERNLDQGLQPKYLKDILSNSQSKESLFDSMILALEVGPLIVGLLHASNPEVSYDAVFPSYVFSPLRRQADIRHNDDSRQPFLLETMAIHYLNRYWYQ